MGKFFKSIGQGIRLAFKTVTYHWKQYFCFFIAILAMETMFGVIVMSSSRNIDQYTENVKTYRWHFAMTNLDEGQRNYFQSAYSEVSEFTVYEFVSNSAEKGSGVIYMRIHLDATKHGSLKQAYNEFKPHLNRMPQGEGRTKPEDVKFQLSPLYELDSKIISMRVECAVKLVVLALVSIAVIILLLNIRLNHFKFTYGIYMSFGADTKKLFLTSFWDMLVIGLLMFVPSALISTVVTYALYSEGAIIGGLIAEFLGSHAPLTFFGLIFLIPICVIAVFIPIKITASKPPLKLLTAQDNSNYVSSPRISTRLIGKKFHRSYESLGLLRFRKYIATVVASSVLFASIFVWISFYSTIYDFNTRQEQAEFTVNINCEMETIRGYVRPADIEKYNVTEDYFNVMGKVYSDNVTTKDRAAFETFYQAEYKIDYRDDGTVLRVYDALTEKNVTEQYMAARDKVVLEGLRSDEDGYYGKSDTFKAFEEFIRDGDDAANNNNPETRYWQVRENGIVVSVYQKIMEMTYVYPENLITDMAAVDSALQKLENEEHFTLLKNIDFSLFKSKNPEDKNATLPSNYVYIGFDKDNVKAFSGLTYNAKLRKNVTTNVTFYPLDANSSNLHFLGKYDMEILDGQDELNLQQMESNGDTKYIIISETAANSQVLDIKPGDKVQIGYTKEITGTYSETLDEDDLLYEVIKNDEIKKPVEYTVYAVIKNMPTSENIPVYLLEEDYVEITGINNISNTFSIYLAPNTTNKEVTLLYEKLVNSIGGQAEIIWNNAVANNKSSIDMKNLPVIQTIAVFSLLLSPLFWFFSQIMFYGKREEEFRMLRGLGATEKEIKKIFQKDGRVFALIGSIATVIFGLIGVFLIHKLNMLYVAFFNNGALQLYRFKMPWVALAAATLVTAICGYMSCIIPYGIDKKKAKRAVAREFGDE